MAKQNWVTQKDLQNLLGLKSIAVVHNWVQRGLINTKIMYGKQLVDSNSLKKGVKGRPSNKVKSN